MQTAAAGDKDGLTYPLSAEVRGRSRTFTGCGTCRSRHLKCDEARPTCSPCLRLKLHCEGYGARLLWISEQGNDGGQPGRESSSASRLESRGSGSEPGSHRSTSYRYPLFTEEARWSMSEELVASLGTRSASDALQAVDTREIDGPFSSLEGPFGVFRAAEVPQEDDQTSSLNPTTDAVAVALDAATDTHDEPLNEEIVPFTGWVGDHRRHSPNMAQLFPDAFSVDSTLPSGPDQSWPDEAEFMDFWPFDDFAVQGSLLYSPPRSPRTPLIRGLLSPEPSSLGNSDAPQRPSKPWSRSRPRSRVLSRVASPAPQPPSLPRDVCPPLRNMIDGVSISLPPSAAPLLRYYKDSVLGSTTPSVNARSSPWKLLILPRALETFAELSLWNTASHTRCTIFFSLLAQAALQLGQSCKVDRSSASRWIEIASAHQCRAMEHLKRALEHESEGDQQAEYTELLMGLLATALVSVPFHGSTAINALLIDAEHLIRLRGFPLRKTFNARVLHHMYTHIRILVESTQGSLSSGIDASQQPSNQAEPDADSQAVRSHTSLRKFGIAEDSLGTDLDLSQEKPPDVGYSDIHLEIYGSWPATLYPDIYGIPESLVTLLSQTVSLANSKPKLDAMAATNPSVSEALSRHVKTLEQNIWSWTVDSSASLPVGPGRPQNLIGADTRLWEHPQVRCMILAMHQALIVYFYRRIYNVSAMIVQEAVRKTMEHLEPCLEILAHDQELACSVGWCISIVACEAATPDLQEKALKCLEKVDDVGIVLSSERPSKMAKAVWEGRAQDGNMPCHA